MNKSSSESSEACEPAKDRGLGLGDLSFLFAAVRLRYNLGDILGDRPGDRACLGDILGDLGDILGDLAGNETCRGDSLGDRASLGDWRGDNLGDVLGEGEKVSGLIEQAILDKSRASIVLLLILGVYPDWTG